MNDLIATYWSQDALAANGIIILNLLGAFALGVVMGYERVYHGRAAGLRTYAIVCMAACGLTIACGFPNVWFGGNMGGLDAVDPTRVIQGIMTGIGFLGAGVIMREGLSIRGLATAASIWMAAAIGILVGLGFYASAIAAALMTTFAMASFRQLETALPHYSLAKVSITIAVDSSLSRRHMEELGHRHGFGIKEWAVFVNKTTGRTTYELTLQSDQKGSQDNLVAELTASPLILEMSVIPMRD